MKVLAIEKEVPNITADSFKPHLKSEASKVWELYQACIGREIYFRQDRSEAILVLDCADTEAAHEIPESLPLVLAGTQDL